VVFAIDDHATNFFCDRDDFNCVVIFATGFNRSKNSSLLTETDSVSDDFFSSFTRRNLCQCCEIVYFLNSTAVEFSE
jgi:hypothetical protein